MAGVDEPLVMVDVAVTCLTEGCENEGVALTVQVDQNDPRVVCGPCGVEISPGTFLAVG